MKKYIPAFFILLGLTPAVGWGDGPDQPSLQDRAFQFFQKNVTGRTQQVSTRGTIKSNGAEYLVTFKALIKWENLQKTDNGLVFDQTRDIQQSAVKLDHGQPSGPVIKTDRVVVFHYALAERATSKSLVGLSTMTKNTLEDPTGKGFVVMVELSDDNKELYLYESEAGFSEGSLDGKSTVPVATASEATLFLDKNGKLEMNETLKFYKVDVNKDFAREEVDRFNLSGTEVTK